MRDSILGHVDSVRHGFITGWIANREHPGRAEDVCCEDASGRGVIFRAWHAREDVAAFLGLSGRFGFVIPLEALWPLDSIVSVRSRYGDVLQNGEALDLGTRRSSQPRNSPTTIVLHIPKTAGTSLRTSLIEGLTPAERLFLYAPPFGLTIKELACLPTAQKRAASLVIGHAMYGVGALLGEPSRYVTFLRDPIKRLQSHLAHHLAAGTVFHSHGRTISLSKAFSEGLSEEFDNLIVRSISGLPESIVPCGSISVSAVELALYNVREHFAYVGFVESMAEDVQRLSAILGRSVALPGTENVGSQPPGLVALHSDIDWDQVLERNQFDIMLYRKLQDLRHSELLIESLTAEASSGNGCLPPIEIGVCGDQSTIF